MPMGETRQYFYAVFSRPLSTYQTWRGDELTHDEKQAGDHIGFVSDFMTRAGEQIEVRVGISYISAEQAQHNLEREIPGWTFEQVKVKTRAIWNDALGGITTMEERNGNARSFYTALYRFSRPDDGLSLKMVGISAVTITRCITQRATTST